MFASLYFSLVFFFLSCFLSCFLCFFLCIFLMDQIYKNVFMKEKKDNSSFFQKRWCYIRFSIYPMFLIKGNRSDESIHSSVSINIDYILRRFIIRFLPFLNSIPMIRSSIIILVLLLH